MIGKTHLSCGIATSLFLCGDVVSGILLSVGSLLPDIDHKNSLFRIVCLEKHCHSYRK